jgi:hypothetical protein
MQRYTVFFITVNALHVSGGFSAHHQELKTVHTASGICQASILLVYLKEYINDARSLERQLYRFATAARRGELCQINYASWFLCQSVCLKMRIIRQSLVEVFLTRIQQDT